jgi:hypothetical protein
MDPAEVHLPQPHPDAFKGPAGGLGQAQVPEALRGFLDRWANLA